MRVTYKYKVYRLNDNKVHKTERLLSLACWCYNHCIALHKRYYRLYGKHLNKYQLQKHLTKLKRQTKYTEWKLLSSQAIQQITEKIDDGYERFFKKHALRPPTFRGKRKYQSLTLKNTGWSLNGNEFVINSLKIRLRFHQSRPIDGDIKTVTLKRDAVGDFWLCFSLETQKVIHPKPKTGKTAGFDFGLKTFLTLSDGDAIESPRFLFSEIDTIRKESRNLSNKVKGSKNRHKARVELARHHRRVEWKREAFHWQTANELVSRFDTLCFEDLNIKAMQRIWGRKISDLAFSSFLLKLEHLANKQAKTVVKIDRFTPTSKVCSVCGAVKELKLSERSWMCNSCGTTQDRDINAAINILRVGTSTLAGGTVRPNRKVGRVPVIAESPCL